MLRALITALVLATSGCGSSLPGPPTGKHPGLAAVVQSVDYPPPPAVIEVVPEQPGDDACVWLDGHWDWIAGRWEWQRGGWGKPPEACYYRPPSMSWPLAGSLQFLRAYWYPNNIDALSPEQAQEAGAAPLSCGRPAQKYAPKKP